MRIHHVLVVALALVALPLAAQSNEVGAWYTHAKLSSTGSSGSAVQFGSANGWTVSYNRFWTQTLSTEFTYSQVKADGGIDVAGTRALNFGKTAIKPVTVNIEWHFLRGFFISPYVGAGGAYVKMDNLSGSDLDVAGVGPIKVDSKFGWDAGAGVDILIGHNFAISVDGKYIPYEPNASGPLASEKLKLNPTLYSAGVKFRF